MTHIGPNFYNNPEEDIADGGDMLVTELNQVDDLNFPGEVENARLQEVNAADSDQAKVGQLRGQEHKLIGESTGCCVPNASLVVPFDIYDYDPLAEFRGLEMSEEMAKSAIKVAGSEITTVFEKSNSKIRIIVTSPFIYI